MFLARIEHWCAGSKLYGLTNAHHPSIKTILTLWKNSGHSSSVLIVSCGAKEKPLMEHLKSIGFKKMRNFKNYGHSSGDTWLMGYQIPKKIWCEHTGYNGKGNWTQS